MLKSLIKPRRDLVTVMEAPPGGQEDRVATEAEKPLSELLQWSLGEIRVVCTMMVVIEVVQVAAFGICAKRIRR